MPSGSKKPAKSVQAIQKNQKQRGGVPASTRSGGTRQIPWLTIGAVVAIVALIGGITAYLLPKFQEQQSVAKFVPSESNQDPSTAIDGVVTATYPAGVHIQPTQRVAYDQSPPFGGPHDAIWATCTGTVYPTAIRTENAVHSLEHGAIWITYNPDTVDDAARQKLADRVQKQSGYMLMSPYPGLDSPISLQSWGHQLKLDSADDERIDQFVKALRLNRYEYPEVGASCSTIPGSFDPANPPPFDASAPGPDAVPMNAGTEPSSAPTGAPAPMTGGNG